jgi:hypothetical protein
MQALAVNGVTGSTTGGTSAAPERQEIGDLAAKTAHRPGLGAANGMGAEQLRRRNATGDRRAALRLSVRSL